MAEPATEGETPLARRTRLALAQLLDAARDAPQRYPWPGPALHRMGLDFPGPVGLAAGFDPQGALLGHAHRLGLGHVELGTVAGPALCGTGLGPAQPDHHGPTAPAAPRAVCGLSLGRHPATPWARAEDELLAGLQPLPPWVDYLTLNPGRAPPTAARFAHLVATVAAALDTTPARPRRPIVVKLPMAWTEGPDGARVAADFVTRGAAGLLLSAEGASNPGAALEALRRVARAVPRETCLISVGGIHSAPEALARRHAGADLIQLHRWLSALGVDLIHTINRALAAPLDSPPP
jgi:dihydroorotate dehydrogenase